MTDEAKLRRWLKEGDEGAFGLLLDLYGGRVQQLCRRYTTSQSDTEDLTQEIFLDIFRCLPTFRGDSHVSTWVYRVALNHCLRHRDKQQRETSRRAEDVGLEETATRPEDKASDPAGQTTRNELSQQVRDAIGELSPVQRDVVILHELHGLTYGQCAAILDVPIGTVKSRLSNAFRSLRGLLGPYVMGDSVESETAPAPALRPTPLGEPS